jgi:hypothetical protein
MMNVDLSKITSGFSDKLRAITFFIALQKKKKNNSVFKIYEKKNTQCPFRFVDYCKIKNIKINVQNHQIKKNKNFVFTPYNSEINLKNCQHANNLNNTINNKELIEAWKDAYKYIMPNSQLQNKIKKIRLPKNFISIHIRSTDRVVKLCKIFSDVQLKDMIPQFQLSIFENRILKFVKKHSNCKNIYISSDQEVLKVKIIKKLKKYEYNVFFNNCSYNNKKYRKTRGEDFLIDLFCLSKSNLILTTVGGGVPDAAYLISGKKNFIKKWVNEFNIFFIFRFFILSIFYLKKIKIIITKFFRFK